jgi:hypothetical protein
VELKASPGTVNPIFTHSVFTLKCVNQQLCQKLTHLLVQELSTMRGLNVYLEYIMRCDYFGNVPDGHACSWMAYGALLVAGRSGLNYYYSLANWRLHD